VLPAGGHAHGTVSEMGTYYGRNDYIVNSFS